MVEAMPPRVGECETSRRRALESPSAAFLLADV
jgi:hypothetical protein